MNVGIIGIGYVGLVFSICLAEKGINIIALDKNQEKIESLKLGKSPIYENEIENEIKKALSNMVFTADYQYLCKNCNIIFVAVDTPNYANGKPDLTNLWKAINELTDYILDNTLVVVKSTVPIGTTDKIQQHFINNGKNVHVAFNPEFLSQGSAINDFKNPSRIIIGSQNNKTSQIVKNIYQIVIENEIPYILTDRKTAEMVKYACNSFLALKISYANELANLCDKIGVNVNDIVEGMKYDKRIGEYFLNAGIGFGGSCLVKDTMGFYEFSEENGSILSLIKKTIDINNNQKTVLYDKLTNYYDSLKGLNIAILGVTFKPKTDDLRNSAAISNIDLLLNQGCYITAYDPKGLDNLKKIYGDQIDYCNSIENAIKDKDAAIIITEWDEIKNFSIDKYIELMKTPIIFDGRNCYCNKDINPKIKYKCIGNNKSLNRDDK